MLVATEQRPVGQRRCWAPVVMGHAIAGDDRMQRQAGAGAGKTAGAAVQLEDHIPQRPGHQAARLQGGGHLPVEPLDRCTGFIQTQNPFTHGQPQQCDQARQGASE